MPIELIESPEVNASEIPVYYTLTNLIEDIEAKLTQLEDEAKVETEATGLPSPLVYSTLGLSGPHLENIDGVESLVFNIDYRSSTCAALRDFVTGSYTWSNRNLPLYLRYTASLVSPIDSSFIPTILDHETNEIVTVNFKRVSI